VSSPPHGDHDRKDGVAIGSAHVFPFLAGRGGSRPMRTSLSGQGRMIASAA
jgi:hypothetical protein